MKVTTSSGAVYLLNEDTGHLARLSESPVLDHYDRPVLECEFQWVDGWPTVGRSWFIEVLNANGKFGTLTTTRVVAIDHEVHKEEC